MIGKRKEVLRNRIVVEEQTIRYTVYNTCKWKTNDPIRWRQAYMVNSQTEFAPSDAGFRTPAESLML